MRDPNYTRAGKRTDEQVIQALKDAEWDLTKATHLLGYAGNDSLSSRICHSPAVKEIWIKNKPERKGKPEWSDEEVIDALEKGRGSIKTASKLLGISRSGLSQRILRNPHLHEVQLDQREGFLDIAELELYKLVEAGEFQAIKFFLERAGRSRGYGERTEVVNITKSEPKFDFSRLSVEEKRLLLDMGRKAMIEGGEGEIDAEFTDVLEGDGNIPS